MRHPSARVLLVEDDADQRFLIARAFQAVVGEHGSIHCASDGGEAIAYLRGDGMFSDRKAYPFPTMLVTDLQMPHVDGFGVLDFLRRNPGWCIIPKIVLSCSDDEDDITTAFLLGATAYHLKPITSAELRVCAEQLVNYWAHCELPPVDDHGRIIHIGRCSKLGSRFALPKAGPRMT